ncbi:hypothetical protein IKP13_09375, partial [bacterium]|nr:hypothetical protein [bacterium]
ASMAAVAARYRRYRHGMILCPERTEKQPWRSHRAARAKESAPHDDGSHIRSIRLPWNPDKIREKPLTFWEK